MNITLGAVKTAIILGELDAHLEDIKIAISTRVGMLEDALKRTLRVGDKVKFNDTVNPMYMRGMVATIVKVNRERIVVKMVDGGVGRFSGNITTPLSVISKV